MLSMNQGTDNRQVFGACREAVTSIIATFEQNKGFFAAHISYLYQQLGYLVQRHRRLRHADSQAPSQLQLQEELFRLFGVRVLIPAGRQLSVLASVIRHLLMADIRMRRQLVVRGGVQLLISEVRQHVCPTAEATNIDMLVLNNKLEEMLACWPLSGCVLELRYFARLGLRDIALELGVASDAIRQELRFAKAWLIASLSSDR